MVLKQRQADITSVDQDKHSNLECLLACLAVIVAPFTWTYLAVIGNVLIRTIDVVLLLLIIAIIIKGKIRNTINIIHVLLCMLTILLVLRSVFLSDLQSMMSAIKICYYSISTIILASIFRELFTKKSSKIPLYALLLSVPIFYTIALQAVDSFALVVNSPSLSTLAIAIFTFWADVFSNNPYALSNSFETKGVAFRNSAGIGFLVLSLFFYMKSEQIYKILFIFFMIIAFLLFSRSVWLMQLFLISLIMGTAKISNKIMLYSLILFFLIFLLSNAMIFEVIHDRITSDVGRSEMLLKAVSALDDAVLFGRLEGANIALSNGQTKVVHNVPIAFGLEVGFLGFIVSSLIAVYFLVIFIQNFLRLIFISSTDRKLIIIKCTLCMILFMRPLLSASFDIYFSIGEWIALAMLIALSKTHFSARL